MRYFVLRRERIWPRYVMLKVSRSQHGDISRVEPSTIVRLATYLRGAAAILSPSEQHGRTASQQWKDIEVDIEGLRRKADAGNLAAQSILGICYLDGIDVTVDYDKAFELLCIAAKRGASRAKAHLARMYAEGLGVERDLPEGIRLYEAAATSGEFLAQIALARILAHGTGVPVDPDAARRWYAAAASQEGAIEDCDELREAKDYVSRAQL